MRLPVAHADVIDHAEAGDHFMGARPGDMAAFAPDHKPELALKIQRAGNLRQVDGAIGGIDGRGLLVEPELFFRLLPPGLGNMIGVIEPDGQKFGRIGGRPAFTVMF